MKTEFIDVSDTRKNLVVEIPSTVVDAEIDKVSKDYSKAARIPGFRPGKVPAKIVRQRFRDQILHDVAHGLIPRAVDEALRERAARYEPVEDRGVKPGDSVVMDLVRTAPPAEGDDKPQTDRHENVTVDIGAAANPPGFDRQLTGLMAGAEKTFDVTYPDDYTVKELAGTTVTYDVSIKSVRKRVAPELDDEFAKDLGEFESLDALRRRVREDLEHEGRHESERELRADLMKQLAGRVAFDVPAALVDREIDRRVEEFVRRLIEQQIDPMRANINWEDFRERQREAASEAVRGALVLDEIARRENLSVSDEEVEAEIARYAERTGRTPAAVRARLEKEGGISRVYAGLRREKAIDFILSRATIVQT